MGKLYCVADISCNRRKEEIEKVGFFLRKNGWVKTENKAIADLVFFYTCGLSAAKVHEAESILAKLREGLKEDAEIIVGGCVPSTDKESLNNVFDGMTICPTDFSALNNIKGVRIKVSKDLEFLKGDLHIDLRARLSIMMGLMRLAFAMMKQYGIFAAIRRQVSKMMKRVPAVTSDEDYSLFVAKGCPRLCSYCAIRFATGELKSKPLDKIMREFKKALKSGKKKFELNADSVGDYGLDIGSNFGELMDAFGKVDKEFTIAILDLHPTMFLKYFDWVDRLCKQNKVHDIYIPIQSGNPRILDLMKRPCDIAKVKEKMIELKKYKNVSLQGCIIIGFPGETDEEFQDSIQFLKDIDYEDNYVHIYSDMPNTESSMMSDKNDKATMLRRYEKIKNSNIKFARNLTEREIEFGYNDNDVS
ncbi:MAG: radical SAM protein [Planctomycetes bacterium]|nr:radical SAM protein [Planctomycetota bacterium]